ncbi:MAG: phosphate signaling complex protein PhoU [Alphaproteobacteria bacterium]|nr:phosphate signaling complex protein PhoU [Alphaproteobacteria bacterium]
MKSDHIVRSFDEDLQQIENLVSRMGGMVELQIDNSAISLVQRDVELAKAVRADDRKIDNLESEIDIAVVRVLALRQPAAQDLRAVVAVLKIAASLERIGDLAKNIAKRSTVLGEFRDIGASANIVKRMCGLVQEMLKDALDAHVTRNINLADDVRMRDVEVDQMHNSLFRELLTYMMEDPRAITPCMHLLFIAKNVERMGDHVTGIAEQIHYVVSGSLPEEERPKSDVTSLTAISSGEAAAGGGQAE